MITRESKAVWNGTLKEGSGEMKVGKTGFEGPYSFGSRFESGTGTNPEELIAGAHAGCFSMAFSGSIEKAGFKPEKIESTAKVKMERKETGFEVVLIEMETRGKVPGMSDEQFQEVAQSSFKNCPISKLLKGAELRLTAMLEA